MFMLTEEIGSNEFKARWYPTYKSMLHAFYWFNCIIAMLYVLVYNIAFQDVMGAIFGDYQSGDVNVARTGIFTHQGAGMIYLVSGYIQFSKSLRTKYPEFHRMVGYLYLWMVFLMCVGIIILLISRGSLGKSVSLFWVLGVWPYWLYVHADGLASIYRKDLARHRRMMFRGFCFGNGIIWMRLPFFTLLVINTSTVQVSLANAFWIVSFMAVGVSEFYVVLEKFFLPPAAVYLKDHKSSFHMATTGIPGQGMAPVGVEVDECEMLPDNTSMKLTFRVKNHNQVPVFFPGQHVALRHKSVPGSAREYSPIVTEDHLLNGQISLWIRLVEGGVMSKHLKAYYEQRNQVGSAAAEQPGQGVQLNPLSADKSHVATEEGNAVALPCPFLLSVSSSRLAYFPNSYRYLIMAATGTGLAPLLPLIQTILNNPNDHTGIYLIYACNGEKDYGRQLLIDISGNDAEMTQLEIEYKMRGSEDSRITVASIEAAAEKLVKHGIIQEGEPRHNIQIHLSGSPNFVKSLDADVAASKRLGLKSRALQLVSWGYTDR